MPFLGDRFRAAREARGLSLADVSEHIHIRALYLDCIEREDWKAIGVPVYTRGFVRSYARFLGLEPEQAVADYAASSGTPAATPAAALIAAPVTPPPSRPIPPREATPSTRRPPPPPPSRPQAPRPQSRRPGGGVSVSVYVLAVVALLLLGAVGYTLYDNSGRSTHGNSGAPASTPVPPLARTTAVPSKSTPSPERTLAFTVNARSWVQIAVDGQAPVAATLDAGTTKVFHGKSAVLRVGNAGGVVVTVDGKTLGPLGASGAVVERTFAL